MPVITLAQNTTKEAVCLVFEKVNTGGKALDAFELVTAMYAAHNFELRKDWFARQAAMSQQKVLRNVASTEFLQAVALLNTKALRDDHLTSHLIDPALLRANDFPASIAAREGAAETHRAGDRPLRLSRRRGRAGAGGRSLAGHRPDPDGGGVGPC